MKPYSLFTMKFFGRLGSNSLGLLALSMALMSASGRGAPGPAPVILNGWGATPQPSSHPMDFVSGTSGNTSQQQMISLALSDGGASTSVGSSSIVSNGVTYSDFADNPNGGDGVLIKLAADLGNDPIKIYEWVRNNIQTEFYIGCNRGAYLTYLERAGNDVDQCALLGALFKAAGYTPAYSIHWLWIPRTATGINRVGAYEWLGVNDDAAVLRRLINYAGVYDGGDYFRLIYSWVTLDLPGRPGVEFVPSLKPYAVGRRPNLDNFSGYSWNNAAIASGSGSTTSYSPALNSPNLKAHLNGLATQASNAIRDSADLHNLSGAELARVPVIIPEIVSISAPAGTHYPQDLAYAANAALLPGIPVTFCSRFSVKVGGAEWWFECPELMGKSLAVEFDANGDGIIRLDGAEQTRDGGSSPSANVVIESTYEFPLAYTSGQPHRAIATTSVIRQSAASVIYSFGRTVGRLQLTQSAVAAKETASPTSVTTTDRLNIIGQQYASQCEELVVIGSSYFDQPVPRHILGGLVFMRNGTANLDIDINLAAALPESASVFGAISLLIGALEGTAIEQLSGNRSVGTPSLIEHAMTLNTGAHYITSVSQLNSAGLQNFNDNTLGSGSVAAIQALLNAGRHVLLLANSNVTFASSSWGGYLDIYPNSGGVATMLKYGNGGGGGGPLGTPAVAPAVASSATTSTNVVAGLNPALSKDPVDLTNGAFLYDATDLTVGTDGEPNGLRLSRNYNSARRISDPTGLGRGWTHNYALKLAMRSPNDIDSQRATVDEVLPLLIAMRHAQDSIAYEPQAARSWLMACTSLTWAVDQQINTRASVALGERTVEFIKHPDGTYRAPSNLTATLTKLGNGDHDLKFRHSNTIRFRASDGKFTSIKDPFDNELTASYYGNGTLSTVTDAYDRSFTFNYSGTTLTGVTDSTGRSVGYDRDAVGFHFTDAEGKSSTLEMDAEHRLTVVKDARDRVIVRNFYDQWHRVYKQHTFDDPARESKLWIVPGVGTEVDPSGGTVWTYFDARGRKIFVVNQVNKLSSWQYDGVDRLVKASSQLGHATQFSYNSNHVLISETNPGGDTRTITPDEHHRPQTVTNFEGAQTVFAYNSQHKIESITLPGGITSTFQYDSRGRLWKAHPAAYAPDEFDTYTYDANGHVDTITRPADANLSDQDFDDYAYNARGDLLEMIDRKDVKTTYTYNARRQLLTLTQWDGSTPHTSQMAYDDAGVIDYVVDASGRKTDSEHDALGNLVEVRSGPVGSQVATLTNSYSDPRALLAQSTDAMGNSTQYAYYATRQLGTITDPLGRISTLGYDDDQRPVTALSPLGFSTSEALDARGYLDGVQDAESQLSDYTYDKDGRPLQMANRLNHTYQWSYHDANRTVTSSTPTGKAITEVRDNRGLLASITQASGQVIGFTAYDNEGRLTQRTDGAGSIGFNYWPNGLPKQVLENGRTIYREYDTLNRLTRYDDGEGHTITYEYHPSGELWKLNYPGGKTVTYGYDDFGRLHTVTDWSARTTSYTYDNASRLTRLDRPNGTYRIQEYDAASQLRFVKEYTSAGSLVTFQELKYDADSRITSSFLHPKPAPVVLPFDSLSYDADNRLSVWNSQAVSFDADGNMTYGPKPTATGSEMTSYTYDVRNRLTGSTNALYRYSSDDERVALTTPSGTTTYVIDPNSELSSVLIRTKPDGTVTYYVYGHGLLHEETGGQAKYYHYDHLGNTVAITDGGQNVTDRVSYAPFGLIAERIGTTDTPFLFHGDHGVQTDANGLVYMRGRYYHPRLMRFLSADPLEARLNHYAFVSNQPTSYIDPLGLDQILVLDPFVVTAQRVQEKTGAVGDYILNTQMLLDMATLRRDMETENRVGWKIAGYTVLAGVTVFYVVDVASNATGVKAAANGVGKGVRKGLGRLFARFSTAGACFTAGTLVMTAAGPVFIETLQVGDRVLTSDATALETQVDAATWKKITVRMPDPQIAGLGVEIVLLRDPQWMAATGCREGGEIHLALPEIGLDGQAEVVAVEACPPIQTGVGRVVLATIRHQSTEVYELGVDGLDKPIEPTGRHPFYSLDRQAWVPVADLQVGEPLRTRDGERSVTSLQRKKGLRPVFNLEVETEHDYFVSDAEVLSHNANACAKAVQKAAAEVKPKLVSNPKHHPNSRSPEPKNARELYEKSALDSNGSRYAKDADGDIHRFSDTNNGTFHWSGSTATDQGLHQNQMPSRDTLNQLNQ
jgi:RHS repeat-associated protein